MKVIFLDIDGVLNPFVCENEILVKENLDNLAFIVQETGAKVVLNSTWKQFFTSTFDGSLEYKNKLEKELNDRNIDMIGCTPCLGYNPPSEVQLWRWTHPECREYVILDDSNMGNRYPKSHYICTLLTDGLTMKQAIIAINILNQN